MPTIEEITAATPRISHNPSDIINPNSLPDDPAELFNVITVIKQTAPGPTNQKIRLWRWLIKTASPRVYEIQQLLYGKISPATFCAIYPKHPACQPILEPRAPRISVSPGRIDFGTRFLFTRNIRRLRIRNNGDANLNIRRLQILGPGQDSFRISLSRTPITIRPGRQSSIRITFTPNRIGRVTAALAIYSNDPEQRYTLVTLIGQGLARRRPVPRRS